jgi:uncharacterized protein HemX
MRDTSPSSKDRSKGAIVEASTASATGRTNIAIALAVAALVIGIAVGVIGLQKGSQNLTRIHRLEAQVRLLTAHTGGAQASVTSRLAATDVKALEAKAAVYSKTDATVTTLTSCLPEVQSEISGLGIEAKEGQGEQHELFGPISITNRQNISKACQTVIYGSEH